MLGNSRFRSTGHFDLLSSCVRSALARDLRAVGPRRLGDVIRGLFRVTGTTKVGAVSSVDVGGCGDLVITIPRLCGLIGSRGDRMPSAIGALVSDFVGSVGVRGVVGCSLPSFRSTLGATTGGTHQWGEGVVGRRRGQPFCCRRSIVFVVCLPLQLRVRRWFPIPIL